VFPDIRHHIGMKTVQVFLAETNSREKQERNDYSFFHLLTARS
jgi:hypothetical protein